MSKSSSNRAMSPPSGDVSATEYEMNAMDKRPVTAEYRGTSEDERDMRKMGLMQQLRVRHFRSDRKLQC